MQLRLMLPVTGLSAFLNNTPVVAMFIPVVTDWARRQQVSASKLLIPLSYASIFGGICTLIGTSTNLVVNGMVQARFGGEGLHMFSITRIGIPCAIAGTLYVVFYAWKFLPERREAHMNYANPREYVVEFIVDKKSSLAGKTIQQAGLRSLPGGYLIEIIRGDHVISAVGPDEVLRGEDRLTFAGMIDSIRGLRDLPGLHTAPEQLFKLDAPRRERCLVEAVVSDTCPLLNRSIREGRFREVYNAVVIAVCRNGERIQGRIGDIVLRAGDTLLVESHAGFIPRQRDSRDFYLVSAVDDSAPLNSARAPIAVVLLLGMVIVAALGWLSMLKAALLAAAGMLILGCCSTGQARKSIEWNVLIVIGSALALGRALDVTGAAEVLAGGLMRLAGNSPWATLAVVYLVTTLFTEIITNNAAAALVFPIAMSTAESLGVSYMPYVMCIMIAASASFATPIGYQTNLMVYGPGGYRFSDFIKIGVPLNILLGIITVLLAPLLWAFN
jgi:di/tricarboxylate transporter